MAMITPDLILQPFASSGDVATVPQSDADGFVNFTDGYTSYYEISLTANNPQAKAVERPAQNYLFNALTKNAQAWQYQAIPPWYSTMTGGYAVNALVMRLQTDGVTIKPYRSLVAANVSDPLTSSTWEYVQGVAEMLANIPMPSGGASGSSAKLITTATSFDTLTNGFWQFQTSTVAAASTNVPIYPGTTSGVAGFLEASRWYNGTSYTRFQRYTDVNGNVSLRFGIADAYGAWMFFPKVGQVQSSAHISGIAAGTASSYTVALVPALAAYTEGFEAHVLFNTANVANAIININGLGGTVIYGQGGLPLEGGEIVAGSVCTLRYSNGKMWLLANALGATQGVAAITVNQVPTLGQAQKSAYTFGTDTSSVVNAYKVTYTPAITTLSDGLRLNFRIGTTNTGAATFSPNGLTAKPIIDSAGNPMVAGELTASGLAAVVYSSSLDSWVLVFQSSSANSVGNLINIQTFTGNGTYTPTPGMKKCRVRLIGGGGGSGIIPATGANQYSAAGGGASGSFGEAMLTASQIGASQTVVVGAAGAAGAAGSAGGTGGTTSLGSLLICPGGAGSPIGTLVASTAAEQFAGGLPGALPSGSAAYIFSSAGQKGMQGISALQATLGGAGAASPFGSGGVSGGASVIPSAGSGYGSGGAGPSIGPSTAAKAGAAGAPGIIIIEEYS